jgi:hypothetical protein
MNRSLIAFVSFAVGAAVGARVDRKELRKKLRPLVESALKNGIAMGVEFRRQATRIVEDLEDLVSEVMAQQAEETTGGTEPAPRDEGSGPDSKPSA